MCEIGKRRSWCSWGENRYFFHGQDWDEIMDSSATHHDYRYDTAFSICKQIVISQLKNYILAHALTAYCSLSLNLSLNWVKFTLGHWVISRFWLSFLYLPNQKHFAIICQSDPFYSKSDSVPTRKHLSVQTWYFISYRGVLSGSTGWYQSPFAAR